MSVSGRQPRPSTVHPSSPGGVTFPGTFAAFSSFLTRNSHSKPSCLPQNRPCDSCLLPRALWDSVSVLDQTVIRERALAAACRGVPPGRAVGTGVQRRPARTHGVAGRSVRSRECQCRHSLNRDFSQSALVVAGVGRGQLLGTGGGRGCGWTVRVRMDIVAK